MIKDAYECAVEYYKDFQSIKGNVQTVSLCSGSRGAENTPVNGDHEQPDQEKSIYCMYFPYVEGMGDLRNDFDQLETKLDAMRKAEVLFIDDLFKPVKGSRGRRIGKWNKFNRLLIIGT